MTIVYSDEHQQSTPAPISKEAKERKNAMQCNQVLKADAISTLNSEKLTIRCSTQINENRRTRRKKRRKKERNKKNGKYSDCLSHQHQHQHHIVKFYRWSLSALSFAHIASAYKINSWINKWYGRSVNEANECTRDN